ncbi:MAG: peptidylprolyl isomerase [Pseudomonadota bacterium]
MLNVLKYFVSLNLCLLVNAALAAEAVPVTPAAPPAAVPETVVSAIPAFPVTLNGREELVQTDSLTNPLVVISTNRGDMLLELFADEAPKTVANFMELAAGTKPFTDPANGQQVTRPLYDGLIFHRVIDGFMIQGGSPTGDGEGTPGYEFADEINAESLGLDKMMLVDVDGVPNPVLGIRSQTDFQQRVLMPLYAKLGITSQESLTARVAEVDERLRTMSVKENYELLGYHYITTVKSRAPVRGVIAMANSGPDTNGSQFFINLADTEWLTGKHTVFGKVRAGLAVLDAIGKTPVNAESRPMQDVVIQSIKPLQR